MPRLPGEFNVSGGEHWLVCVQVRERVYRAGRGHVHSVCGGDVQDECRDRRVHGVRRRQVLWSGGGYRGERMHGVPGAHELRFGQLGADRLHVHPGVHGGGGRRGVRSVRGRDVQVCNKNGELLAVRGGNVLW